MPSSLRPPAIERARPLLGTLVTIHAEAGTAQAIDAAFAEIAEVHALMSFHEPASDLSRLNAAAPGEAVRLDPRTAEVLAFALELARRSEGAFDPTIASLAVERGELPRPDASPPNPQASWRDLILEDGEARLQRRAWLDLGGVAKGYAVDRAIARLAAAGVRRAVVNAGGDLRVLGEAAEPVALRAGDPSGLPVIEISDGALASSGGDPGQRSTTRCHDPRTGVPIPATHFACVVAPSCMVADALTKAVLAGAATPELLDAYAARAWTFAPAAGWRAFGQEAA